MFATFIKDNGVTATLQASKDNLATICDNRTTICATASFITIVTNEEVNSVGDDVVIPPPNNVPACDGTLQYIFLYNEAVVGAILDPNTGDLTIPAQLIQVPIEYIIYVTCNGLVIATVRYVFTNPTTTTTTSTTTTTTTSTTTTTTTTSTSTSTTTVDESPGLRLTYTTGNLPANDLAAWNSLFDLPTNGTAFTSLSTSGDEVTLIGGSGITLKQSLFRTSSTLLKIEDDVDCVVAIAGGKGLGAVSLCSALTTVTLNGSITIGEEGLYSNASLTYLSATSCATMGKGACANNTILSTFSLPALTSAGESCFSQSPLMNFFDGVSSNVCPLLTTLGPTCFLSNTATPAFLFITATNIPSGLFEGCSCIVVSIPSCTTLGQTNGYNNVFLNCTNLTTVYCPTALATVDGGNPDGDLVYAVGLGATINYI